MVAYDRISLETLLQSNKGELKQKQHELNIAVLALETLEQISRVIREAGGAHDEKMLGELRVGDMALLFARNNIEITARYRNPKPETSQEVIEESYEKERTDWLKAANQHVSDLFLGKSQVASTNGYCDSCGEMYTRGWEKTHPNCKRV